MEQQHMAIAPRSNQPQVILKNIMTETFGPNSQHKQQFHDHANTLVSI